MRLIALAVLLAAFACLPTEAFTMPGGFAVVSNHKQGIVQRAMITSLSEKKDDGVIELADDDESETAKGSSDKTVAPFLSQGDISEEAMDMDFSDPKQARVMFYIILSLVPILFLIPLMLGSRELIPAEMLPPVEL